MLGRGLLGDPSLVTRVRGGERAGSARLQAFHDTLFARYCDAFGDSRIAVLRMKELWFYFGNLFENSEKLQKSIKKAKNAEEFERAATALFCSCEVRGECRSGVVPPGVTLCAFAPKQTMHNIQIRQTMRNTCHVQANASFFLCKNPGKMPRMIF